MTDPLATSFSIANTIIMFAGVIITLYGQSYFKEGIIVKTLKRGTLVISIIFLHFLLSTLNDLSILSVPTFIGDMLEFCFTIGLLYLAYNYVRDWQVIGKT